MKTPRVMIRLGIIVVTLIGLTVASIWALRGFLSEGGGQAQNESPPATASLPPANGGDEKLIRAAARVPLVPTTPAPSALSVALHPSQVDFDVPTVGLAMQGDDIVAQSPVDASGDDRQSRQNLIETNLAMEKARQFVTSMCADQEGNVWVGTEGGGAQRFTPSAPPGHQWKQFTAKDGLGDDYVYAIACDRKGRIWVGHLRHGVSVYSGRTWKNYEIAGGLSGADTLSGPLGERVFHITVCPTDGDVWMATNRGLARYSESKDDWTYFTRSSGVVSDQAGSIAFDADGNLYVGTHCDGIAMADAREDYKTWRLASGPSEEPTSPDGDGLPSNLINDVLVAADGTIYAASDLGVAHSDDHGETWHFVRGEDWAAKAPRAFRNTPPLVNGSLLAEDYCTCLAEGADGIWVGHRAVAGADVLHRSIAKLQLCPADYVTCILPRGGGGVPLVGTYGGGVQALEDYPVQKPLPPSAVVPAIQPPLPSGAAAPTLATLQSLVGASTKKEETTDKGVMYLGADWTTQGDWPGRYGWNQAVLLGAAPPFDHAYDLGESFGFRPRLGPLAISGDTARGYLRDYYTDDPRSLWDLNIHSRRQSEWDDHGETYAAGINGPDLQMKFELPEGVYRVSLYVVNPDGHDANNRRRDLVLEVKPYDDDVATVSNSPAEARCRIKDFYCGVYEQFLIRGPSKHFFLLRRNHGLNALCSGVFFERVWGPGKGQDTMARAMMGNVTYGPPAIPDLSEFPDAAKSVAEVWREIDAAYQNASPSAIERNAELILSYRPAAAGGAPLGLLANMRWALPVWTPADRTEWSGVMEQAFQGELRMNPGWAQRMGEYVEAPGPLGHGFR